MFLRYPLSKPFVTSPLYSYLLDLLNKRIENPSKYIDCALILSYSPFLSQSIAKVSPLAGPQKIFDFLGDKYKRKAMPQTNV